MTKDITLSTALHLEWEELIDLLASSHKSIMTLIVTHLTLQIINAKPAIMDSQKIMMENVRNLSLVIVKEKETFCRHFLPQNMNLLSIEESRDVLNVVKVILDYLEKSMIMFVSPQLIPKTYLTTQYMFPIASTI